MSNIVKRTIKAAAPPVHLETRSVPKPDRKPFQVDVVFETGRSFSPSVDSAQGWLCRGFRYRTLEKAIRALPRIVKFVEECLDRGEVDYHLHYAEVYSYTEGYLQQVTHHKVDYRL